MAPRRTRNSRKAPQTSRVHPYENLSFRNKAPKKRSPVTESAAIKPPGGFPPSIVTQPAVQESIDSLESFLSPPPTHHATRTDKSRPSFWGLTEQNRELEEMYPDPDEHPFPVRVPVHPEDSCRDQDLQQIGDYRYPHTATFMDVFPPSAEKKMIEAFEALRGRKVEPAKLIIPPAATFVVSKTGPEAERLAGGWGQYVKDLFAMGYDWAALNLGLRPPTPPPTPPRPKRKRNHYQCVRNGGGPTSFLSSTAFPNSDEEGSETEEEPEWFLYGPDFDMEVVTHPTSAPLLPQNGPVETVFGKEFVVKWSRRGSWRIEKSALHPDFARRGDGGERGGGKPEGVAALQPGLGRGGKVVDRASDEGVNEGKGKGKGKEKEWPIAQPKSKFKTTDMKAHIEEKRRTRAYTKTSTAAMRPPPKKEAKGLGRTGDKGV
ncbi:hypothetical protein K491DRAFT_676013 [Lophiostoma macrostomum CBS 122681]|uniref:Uncharacterized protein n=1 Tax=Lophiostoma macrostomum CBS 122681 TaxID=1314788 RepID=A0A6A6TJR9_9PLEO|nr:hypothetical protein K491DRAFT_676013 [Lophiostoma macrostomum CBS 122681]